MQQAMMKIDKGEEIAKMLVSSYISGTGYYKLLSKQKADKTFEWVHFTERVNGNKENVYRGNTTTAAELETVIEIMNRNLLKIFGPAAEMKSGNHEVKTLWNNNIDKTVN